MPNPKDSVTYSSLQFLRLIDFGYHLLTIYLAVASKT